MRRSVTVMLQQEITLRGDVDPAFCKAQAHPLPAPQTRGVRLPGANGALRSAVDAADTPIGLRPQVEVDTEPSAPVHPNNPARLQDAEHDP